VNWTLACTAQARRDAKQLGRSGLKPQAQVLLDILARGPYAMPPPCGKLVGDRAGACSRRANNQRRLVCRILDDIRTAKAIRRWTRYE
jgi:toxin YoeB